jgi:hypothetical protein
MLGRFAPVGAPASFGLRASGGKFLFLYDLRDAARIRLLP